VGEAAPMIDAELIPLLTERFKALADVGRLTLLAALQRGERSVGELAVLTRRSQPNVSQQLASLAHAGLVAARREGTKSYYRIADATVTRICDAVCESVVASARRRRRKTSSLLVAAGRGTRVAHAR
jgi:DNA-binding transcriptional ArsR family regulator